MECLCSLFDPLWIEGPTRTTTALKSYPDGVLLLLLPRRERCHPVVQGLVQALVETGASREEILPAEVRLKSACCVLWKEAG